MFDATKCKLTGHARSKTETRPRFYTTADESGAEVRHEMAEQREICSRCGEPLKGPPGKWKPVIE